MKKVILLYLLLTATVYSSCNGKQTQHDKTNLSALEFSEKIKELPTAEIIDVRTPDEFSKGHLINAKNINWNGADFEKQVAMLDKSKPVMVYCLSGGRSASAAQKMRAIGFTKVYEMDGGIMKWRREKLPENTSKSSPQLSKITLPQFQKMLETDKIVLVDFYAEWCGPCKKIKPHLDAIQKEMGDKLLIIRINTDNNYYLSEALNIDAIPVLQVYKNRKLTWTNTGYIDKESIKKALK